MRRIVLALIVAGISIVVVRGTKAGGDDDDWGRFHFAPDSLVLTRSFYTGNADTVKIGETLPPGCAGGPNGTTNVTVPTLTGSTTSVAVTCGVASDNGEFPNDRDSHNVWNNTNSDGSFGITSPILLDNISTDGWFLGTLPVPTGLMVTSFSSKSELALNLSVDGKSLSFMGYVGGPGCGDGRLSPTRPNLIDVSASSTPAVCDPTNPVISSFVSNPAIPTAYYRGVAEVDASGHISVTHGNAYSGDNGRAAIKGGNGLYYMVGNDNSGNLSKAQLPITQIGQELINATGAEMLIPGQLPPAPPNIAMIGRLQIGKDKPGKDTNFRGLTIFDNTLYISKGSGGNGINTVYQVGSAGVLPTGSATELAAVPITPLPGFPNTTASTSTSFPFGIWFANANTLYVCDEGDGTLVTGQTINGQTVVVDAQTLATAGLQKWVRQNGTWVMAYVLQNGLDLGVPYSVAHYQAFLNPATGGCRNVTGRVNGDGTVTIWAITSTVSANGDQGADPNKLVKVSDVLSATSVPSGENGLGVFKTVRTARRRSLPGSLVRAEKRRPILSRVLHSEK